MIQPGIYTLTDVVEMYNMMQGNHRRKNFDNNLFFAKQVWNEVFTTTLMAYSLVYLCVKRDSSNKYPYIDLPENTSVFIGLYDTNKEGLLVPMSNVDGYDIVVRPRIKTCGCKKDCGCGEACSSASNTSMVIKDHVIEGVTYQEKVWQKVCDDGSIIEHRLYPTKEYYEQADDVFGPEFGPEFHDDMGLFRVTFIEDQRRIAKVDLLPCGCVAETPANKEAFAIVNGVVCLPVCATEKKVQVQREGDRLYLIGGNIKEGYVAQLRERCASANSLVPENALWCMYTGIELHSTAVHPVHRMNAQYFENRYRAKRNELVMSLNPIDLDVIEEIQKKQKQL